MRWRALLFLVPLLAAAGPAAAAELVMFEQAGCPICLRWNHEIAAIYPKTPEAARAPLRRAQLGTDGGLVLKEPVLYTPTFVLAERGEEVGRLTGYRDDAGFWGLLGMLLDRLPPRQHADIAR